MSAPHARDHVASRPTWRCRACGIAWPCSAAKVRLLAEYRGNTPGLMVFLVTLREEATAQLAELNPSTPLPDLHRRFTDWVRVRSGQPSRSGCICCCPGDNNCTQSPLRS